MKIFKKLNLNIISIILAILVTFSASLLIFKGIKNYKSGNQPQVNIYACTCDDPDTHYCFDASNSHEYLADWYDYNTEYRIKNYAGLTSFASAVNNGYNFSGKTVNLLADIDCQGNGMGIGNMKEDRYFQGTFDGKGYSIYNFVYDGGDDSFVGNKAEISTWLTVSYYTYGLFKKINGLTTIKNLYIYDVDDTFGCNYQECKDIGGLVGYSDGGRIENCKINDINITANFSGGDTYVVHTESGCAFGGVFAVGFATIINCEISNVKLSGSMLDNEAGVGPARHSYTVYGVPPVVNIYSPYTVSESTIEKCVIYNLFEDTYNITSFSSSQWTYQAYFTGSGIRHEHGTLSHSISNCYNSKMDDDFVNLGTNISVGGESGSAWYYGGTNYNEGWPKLRQFISVWSTINFGARLIEGASVTEFTTLDVLPDKTSIEIPADAGLQGIASENTIIFYLQIVTAKPTNNIYSFKNWRKDNDFKWFAEYEWKQYTITFNSTIGETTIAPTGVSSVIVSYGAKINLITTESNKLQYEVVDVNNADAITIITYDFSGMQYCIIKDNAGVADKFEVTADLTITPTATLKQYGSVWQ